MGGVEQHVRQLATGLVARGAVVTVICPETEEIDAFAADCAAGGADIVRMTLSRRQGWVGALRRGASTIRVLRTRRINVLHVHLIGWQGGRWAVLAGRAAGVQTLVCTIHLGLSARARWPTRVERKLWNRAVDRFIAVSGATRRAHIAHLGQSASKTVAIPNGVELERHAGHPPGTRESVRRSWDICESAVVIGSVGRLTEQKAIDVLVRATPLILAQVPDVRVLIVGDGSERSRLERLADELGVRDVIVFAGSRTDVPHQLSAMDVFVLPSIFEGLPLAVLEAMAAGLPVVATTVDGVPEVVQKNVTGLLVPTHDHVALARSVTSIISDRDRAARFSSAARARAGLFTVDLLVERVVSVYRSAKNGQAALPD
jgi:glycosyltransferase involved in cell wall biosynthesis